MVTKKEIKKEKGKEEEVEEREKERKKKKKTPRLDLTQPVFPLAFFFLTKSVLLLYRHRLSLPPRLPLSRSLVSKLSPHTLRGTSKRYADRCSLPRGPRPPRRDPRRLGFQASAPGAPGARTVRKKRVGVVFFVAFLSSSARPIRRRMSSRKRPPRSRKHTLRSTTSDRGPALHLRRRLVDCAERWGRRQKQHQASKKKTTPKIELFFSLSLLALEFPAFCTFAHLRGRHFKLVSLALDTSRGTVGSLLRDLRIEKGSGRNKGRGKSRTCFSCWCFFSAASSS